MAASLIVESAGPGATIQDAGRDGMLRFGVTPAGPMDWVAFETANRVLGNNPRAAAIEIGLGGIALRVSAPVVLAFCGGGFAWSREDQGLPAAARLLLRPGETLRARAGDGGMFAYCAVPGGIDVPEVMGARATHTRSKLGGLDGRTLRGGDRLEVAQETSDLDNVRIDAAWLQPSNMPIRAVLGPQDDHFTEEAIVLFQNAEFKISPSADRMAYRLEGPKLAHGKDFNIVSDGIALGAIQVAGDGHPMVLMADRQPTGGYAKIAHICRADIGRFAQLRPGERVRFQVAAVDVARQAYLDLIDRAACIPVAPLRLAPTAVVLGRVNLVGGVFDGSTAP